jgi:D-glycero-D-manno-heptose 1,7-bisphosphate phosphatase
VQFHFPNLHEVQCIQSPNEYSAGHRLLEAKKYITGSNILICYCDNLINETFVTKTLNELEIPSVAINPRDEGNTRIQDNGTIEYFRERNNSLNFVELGYLHIETIYFFQILETEVNLGTAMEKISRTRKVTPLKVEDYKSISDISRYSKLRKDRDLILLDRDGVINGNPGKSKYVKYPNQLIFISRNLTFFRRISETYNLDFVVISNQAGIARGLVSPDEVLDVNRKVAIELLLLGVPVLAFYVCPHHWNYQCGCRKPKPGLIYQAVQDFNLTKKPLCLIGDTSSDVEAAKNAGIEGFLLEENLNDEAFRSTTNKIEGYIQSNLNL